MKDMKLMLVDDEERFLSTTRKVLMKRGYEVFTARSGLEALALLKQYPINIVILDVKMPGMDGMETLKEIKKHFPRVDVMMLTGHATLELARDGIEFGAKDFVIKPADIDELIQKAEKLFELQVTKQEHTKVGK
jgi:DNA-binding NtrC family response regulator